MVSAVCEAQSIGLQFSLILLSATAHVFAWSCSLQFLSFEEISQLYHIRAVVNKTASVIPKKELGRTRADFMRRR